MNKKVVVLGILAVCLSISIGIGFSYAVWTQTAKQSTPNLVQTGCFEISLTNEENVIDLANQYPISDEKGKTKIPYTFTVTNTCSIYASYAVNLEKLAGSNMDNEYIKVMLNNKLPQLYNYYSVANKEEANSIDSRTLTTDGLEAGESKEYSLRIWLDESGTNETVGGKTFNSKIVISAVATYQSGAEYIASLLKDNLDTMKNDDPDENVRYIGATPNNYVTFNNEKWRIIGVFDTFECDDEATTSNYQSQCSTKKLLKIIRNDSIGAYSWDSSDSNVNGGFGINEWSTAAIQIALNTAYYNSQKGICYYTSNKAIKECDFSQTSMKGLDETARNQVARVMWSTGTLDKDFDSHNSTATAQIFYNAERSNYNGKICTSGERCTDKVPRTTKWIGKVGLMYPSDYGYATSGGTIASRETCLKKELSGFGGSDVPDCKNNDWLYNSKYVQWTITSVPRETKASCVFGIHSSGYVVYRYDAYGTVEVRPVIYLKSRVKIVHDETHDGSEGKPYELEMN